MAKNDQAPSWKDDPLWYKDAIIYQMHVKAFFDSNNDGTGDFRGLAQKLDYIQELGVNTIWLLPFYPSPMRDDGYDIADYRNIHHAYGSRKDFRQFVRAAHRRGLKVVTELIINHTSDQNPWFQAARKAPRGSAKRDFYVWSDSDKKFPETRIIFSDTETSNWAWDPVAQAYYWHRFFSHQPDLNHNNPRVVQKVIGIMRFWLDLGVDGLRLDAIPYLCVREGTNNENLPETHAVIKQIRAAVDEHYDNRMLLAEANQWPEDVREYFGDGDECHMAYHFPLMPRMYMAVAQEDRHPIVEIMKQTPVIPETCQWAMFLRNHDELTLEMVTDRERDYMYETYASDRRMRLNLGIRRRLAPLMENNADKIKLMNSLLMSMPGSPIIYYGDEIGMGDNFFLGDRNGVRTPMQWSPDRNGGFSRADPQLLYLPPIMDPIYGFEAVNVEAQNRDPSSLLNWMKRLIAVRKAYKAFGRGSLRFLRPGNRHILAYVRELGDEKILCVVNLSRTAQPVELDLTDFIGLVPVETMGLTGFPPIEGRPYVLTLPGYGVYWFQLKKEAELPAWHSEPPPLELPVLILVDLWNSFFPERVAENRRTHAEDLCRRIEEEILPQYLQTQRWFAGKGREIDRVTLGERAVWEEPEGRWLLAEIAVESADRPMEIYFFPLALLWHEEEEHVRSVINFTLGKVRQRARVGILCDAFADESFCRTILKAMRRGSEVSFASDRVRFSATAAFDDAMGADLDQVSSRRPGTEGSNTAVVLEEKGFLKAYRRPGRGINPELEIGLFLTEVSPFSNIAPLLGAIERRSSGGELISVLGILQGYVENQGDAWTYTLNYLGRYLSERLVVKTPEEKDEAEDEHASYLALIHTLGRRTGELHRALAVKAGEPAFDPEPVTGEDIRGWFERVREDAERVAGILREHGGLPEELRPSADRFLEARGRIVGELEASLPEEVDAVKTRHHGDYHLGQVLVSGNDFIIIDFEGEPARPLEERRTKHSALRDVAGMLRSFSYAARESLSRLTVDQVERVAEIEPLALEWQELAEEAFLSGYREAVKGCPVYPEDRDHGRALLRLFLLEKALYELRYELDNRPGWVKTPLEGLLSFVEAG